MYSVHNIYIYSLCKSYLSSSTVYIYTKLWKHETQSSIKNSCLILIYPISILYIYIYIYIYIYKIEIG